MGLETPEQSSLNSSPHSMVLRLRIISILPLYDSRHCIMCLLGSNVHSVALSLWLCLAVCYQFVKVAPTTVSVGGGPRISPEEVLATKPSSMEGSKAIVIKMDGPLKGMPDVSTSIYLIRLLPQDTLSSTYDVARGLLTDISCCSWRSSARPSW
jgi:hypothetical protein